MAETAPAAGSVQSTAITAGGTTGAIVVAQWLVDPSWPPPMAVLTVIVGALIPVIHLLGTAIYKRLALVADAIDGPNDTEQDTAEAENAAELLRNKLVGAAQ